MPQDPVRTLSVTQQIGAVGVGRSHEDEPLALVLPSSEVRALSKLLQLARARVLSSPAGTGSDAMAALVNRLSDIINKYDTALRVDSLTVRQSHSTKEALSEIERLAQQIDKL